MTMLGYDTQAGLIRSELQLAAEDGRDAAVVRRLVELASGCGEDASTLDVIERELLALPTSADFPYVEPDDLPSIFADASPPKPAAIPDDSTLLNRLHGAWLGRCGGCTLGKPVECFNWNRSRDPRPVRARLKQYLTAVSPDEWPIRFYFPGASPASAEAGAAEQPDSTREHVKFVETDDDLRYTVLAQMILTKRTRSFNTLHVAKMALEHLPFLLVATAEMQAYRNLAWRYGLMRGMDEASIDWNWVATHQNPYREWIGAQIRADGYGYAAPGDPRWAADMAWRDARMSHTRNGRYGAMFTAAVIAAALGGADIDAAIQAGLSVIPRRSRFHETVVHTIATCDRFDRRFDQFEAVHDAILEPLKSYNWVHVLPNAAIVVSALLLGGGDYERTISAAVMAGYDTDCNGATAGSTCGAMIGAEALPRRWTDPLNDTLYSAIPGYHPISIRECARRSLAITQTS